jgi:hypothetical protein
VEFIGLMVVVLKTVLLCMLPGIGTLENFKFDFNSIYFFKFKIILLS